MCENVPLSTFIIWVKTRLFSLFLTNINDAELDPSSSSTWASRMSSYNFLLHWFLFLYICLSSPSTFSTCWCHLVGLSGEAWALRPSLQGLGNLGKHAGIATNPTDWSATTIWTSGYSGNRTVAHHRGWWRGMLKGVSSFFHLPGQRSNGSLRVVLVEHPAQDPCGAALWIQVRCRQTW